MFVKYKAPIGGEQYLSSFWTANNKMMETCPDDLGVVEENFPCRNGQPQTTHTPAIFHKDGRVLCQLVYRVFEGTNLLSNTQWTALGAFECIDNENAIEPDVQHYYRLGLQDLELAWAKPEEHEEALFHGHLRTGPEDQTIPITNFDSYGLTNLSSLGHG
ncbi:hypothetical protein ACJZ2D_005490 [Fusarium nematophilum]